MKFKTAIILVTILSTVSLARPPKVIRMVPENGDTNVKPGPTKIRILFDQDMDTTGYSVCGGGENFPEIIGTPRWAGKRALVFATDLKPNHDYTFGINSPSSKNFKSASGEPAEVLVVQFRTAGADGEPSENPPKISEEANRQAIDKLRQAIENHYSYKDMKNVDWNELFAQYDEALLNAATAVDFAKTAGLLLAHTKDKHIWLKAGDQTIPAYVNPVTPNANFPLLPKLVPNFKKYNANICTGNFPGNIGYIYIDSWNINQKQDFDQLYAALNEFAGTQGLIIDVRGNGGGSETLAREFAGCFIDQPKVYAKHVIRDPDAPGDFTQPQERILEPNKSRPQYRGKVAVLIGPVVMSSCEAFVLMMKQVPGCVLVGEPTQGSSGNPQSYDLGNGVTVYLPCWKALLPDETCFEGVGIQPNIPVKVRPDQITTADPVIEAARKALAAK